MGNIDATWAAVWLALLLLLQVAVGCDADFTDLRPAELRNPVGGEPTPTPDGTPEPDPTPTPGDVATPTPQPTPTPGPTPTITPDPSPEISPTPSPTPEPMGPVVLASGDWEGRSSYTGRGTVRLERAADGSESLVFSADFQTSSVPGPVVLISSRDRIRGGIDRDEGDIELGVLQSTRGEQRYTIPGGAGERRVAWVYCRPFGVEIARAFMEDAR